MQTFLPYPNFKKTFKCLDWRRLNKQRLEAKQIYNIISGITPDSRWRFHPCIHMWVGYENCLALYHNLCIKEWVKRGYNNNMEFLPVGDIILPDWFGNRKFHSCHRSTLLFKNYEWYSQFGWKEEPKYEYVWPVRKEELIRK